MVKDYFYRVRIALDEEDPADQSVLAFDFASGTDAVHFADTAYNACDIVNVRIDIIHNEIDTTNSPMWRVNKQQLNTAYGLKAQKYFDTDSCNEERRRQEVCNEKPD